MMENKWLNLMNLIKKTLKIDRDSVPLEIQKNIYLISLLKRDSLNLEI